MKFEKQALICDFVYMPNLPFGNVVSMNVFMATTCMFAFSRTMIVISPLALCVSSNV